MAWQLALSSCPRMIAQDIDVRHPLGLHYYFEHRHLKTFSWWSHLQAIFLSSFARNLPHIQTSLEKCQRRPDVDPISLRSNIDRSVIGCYWTSSPGPGVVSALIFSFFCRRIAFQQLLSFLHIRIYEVLLLCRRTSKYSRKHAMSCRLTARLDPISSRYPYANVQSNNPFVQPSIILVADGPSGRLTLHLTRPAPTDPTPQFQKSVHKAFKYPILGVFFPPTTIDIVCAISLPVLEPQIEDLIISHISNSL